MYTLDEEVAFRVMGCFVRRFAASGGGDLLTLMTDIDILSDGRPSDPAAWSDRIACVEETVAGRKELGGT